jgi:large subunit ribosomal protein L28
MSRKCDLLGTGVMSGNKVSHSNRKTRRRFLPNLKTLAFKSDSLGTNVSLKITTATLRTINKYGNIDSFLINCRHAKLTVLGQTLKTKIKKKLVKLGKLEEVKIVKEKKVLVKKVVKKAAKAAKAS